MVLTMIAAAAVVAAPQRHVLFFLVDDLGYADVGYHGGSVGSGVITPKIDELSGAGVRLENYYVHTIPPCYRSTRRD